MSRNIYIYIITESFLTILHHLNYVSSGPIRQVPATDNPSRNWPICLIWHPYQRTGGIHCEESNKLIRFQYWAYLYTLAVSPKIVRVDVKFSNKQRVTSSSTSHTKSTRYFDWNTSRWFLVGSPVDAGVSRWSKDIDYSSNYWCQWIIFAQSQFTLPGGMVVIHVMACLQS